MTRFSLFSKEDAAMKKNLFRSRLFLCAPAAFCLCATLLCACSAQGNAVSASVHEQALAQLKAQDAELQALTEQVAELKAALADAQRAAVSLTSAFSKMSANRAGKAARGRSIRPP